MASMEEVNNRLNTAKAGFEHGRQLTQQADGRAEVVYTQLENMWDIVHGLRRNSLATVGDELAADVVAGCTANSEALSALSGTFAEDDTAGLNPHIRAALTYGDEATRHLLDSEQVDLKAPIGIGELQQRIQTIGQHIGALFEEIRLARNATRLAAMHVEKSTHRGMAARDEITAYQQENGLQ